MCCVHADPVAQAAADAAVDRNILNNLPAGITPQQLLDAIRPSPPTPPPPPPPTFIERNPTAPNGCFNSGQGNTGCGNAGECQQGMSQTPGLPCRSPILDMSSLHTLRHVGGGFEDEAGL